MMVWWAELQAGGAEQLTGLVTQRRPAPIGTCNEMNKEL